MICKQFKEVCKRFMGSILGIVLIKKKKKITSLTFYRARFHDSLLK